MDTDLHLNGSSGEPEVDPISPNSIDCESQGQDVVGANQLNALEEILAVGSQIESVDVAYALYCDYAKLVGFSVKKGSQAYFTNSLVIRMKAFLCSSEGSPDEKRSCARLTSYKKSVIRTNCKARLRIIRDCEGPWTVSVFVKDHNHELISPEHSYLIRSSRGLSFAQKTMLEVFQSSGISIAKACNFMEKEARGVQNVGFIPKDAYAHMERVKRKSLIHETDADSLLRFFRDKSSEEPFFYWNYQRDDEGRLMNFFFRDSQSALDYDFFGDVLLVDTTYRTNKYNLIVCPFVGINHHRSNTLFGIGFLSEETTTTFEWLFGAFLESMNGKEPVVIYSDQCKALMNGIDNTFQTSSHRLCQWHINQKTPKRFGKMKDDDSFEKLWFQCMNDCETVEEFEENWKLIMAHEQIIDRKWFKKMYKLRGRWASVFTNDKFSAGVRATSRSELTNKVLKDLITCSTTLIEFVMKYQELQNTWRKTEGEMDAVGIWKPGQFVPGIRLLTYAASIYTRPVFKCFEKQAGYSMLVRMIEKPANEEAEVLQYVVHSSSAISGRRIVTINRTSQEATCSCRMWETDGIYCRHMLKILIWLDVEVIPANHILRRWTSDAKLRVSLNNPADNWRSIMDKRLQKMVFINSGMRSTYALYMHCSQDAEKSEALDLRVSELMKEFGLLKCNTDANAGEETSPTEMGERLFTNPMKANGGWVPGKRVKDTKGTKKKYGQKKKKQRVSTKQPDAPEKNVPEKTQATEEQSTSLLTQWRHEYNLPSTSNSVFLSFEKGQAYHEGDESSVGRQLHSGPIYKET